MRKIAFIGLVCALLATSARAQILSASATVNPTSTGSTVNWVVEATQPVTLTSGCGFTSIHQGSPTGPIVFQPFICPFILITVGPNGPYTIGWSGTNGSGQPVPAGTYYVKIDGNLVSGGSTTGYFPVRIDAPATAEPTLQMNGAVTRGQSTGFTINGEANALYFMFASLTTNVGIDAPGFPHFALDTDFLFNLTTPVPHPNFFANWIGALDATGQTTAPQITIPNLPGAGLIGLPMAFQAVIVGTSTQFTNPVTASLN